MEEKTIFQEQEFYFDKRKRLVSLYLHHTLGNSYNMQYVRYVKESENFK